MTSPPDPDPDPDPDPTHATGLLIYEVLRLHGRLIAAGDALMAGLGLSSARWQVLGTVAASAAPLTVSDVARILGQSRQSVQRLVNEMERDGLLEAAANPAHRRATLVRLTAAGRDLHAAAEARRLPWTEGLAAGLGGADAAQAARTLAALRRLLERAEPPAGG
ncbi:MarR family winged helix-turn-helix transcriptional regulator [Azorhizobium doebereinerae]|uniref:MarR family winged helix-turn-helix transcriptional regulator n=1 Tax=Azorhizobium doebereinerae TaxID=281091 RepID=UPI0004124E54|nr:helix-turn-helix domain-containing protein [Azorhizobium doebereinerae]